MAFEYRARSKEQWEARASGGGGDYEGWLKDEYRSFTPQQKENCVRILPPSPSWDAPHYGLDVWVHYGVGPDKASVICLFRMRKGNCPICEERVRAERAKDEDMVRELRAAKRTLVFILNKKDESLGPLAWGMPKTLDEAITKVAKDRSTGEFYFVDSPTEGYDIYFDREGDRLNTKYSGVALAKRPSALPERILDWVADRPIPDALRWRSYDEVKRLFTGAGRGEAPDENPPPRRSNGGGGSGGRSERRDDPPRRAEQPEEYRERARSDEYRERLERPRSVAEEIDDEIPFDTDDERQAAPERDERPERPERSERAEQLKQRLNIRP